MRRHSKHRKAGIFLSVLVGAVLAAAVSASAASASPEWHFKGTLLAYMAQETVVAEAAVASLTIPGLTTTCKPLVLELEVENLLGGPGVGDVTGAQLDNCDTDSAVCDVDSAGADGLPWPVHLTTIDSEHYLVIEGIEMSIFFGGFFCALDGIDMEVKGAAGGLVDDSTHTVIFDPTTMDAVGAELKAFGVKVEFNGTFDWFPTGSNVGSPLTVL